MDLFHRTITISKIITFVMNTLKVPIPRPSPLMLSFHFTFCHERPRLPLFIPLLCFDVFISLWHFSLRVSHPGAQSFYSVYFKMFDKVSAQLHLLSAFLKEQYLKCK